MEWDVINPVVAIEGIFRLIDDYYILDLELRLSLTPACLISYMKF